MNFINAILEWVYPPNCMGCKHLLPVNDRRRVTLRLCAHCQDLLEPLAPPLCSRCGSPLHTNAPACSDCRGRAFFFTHNQAAFVYDDVMRDFIHEIKFRNKKYFATGLGILWAELCNEKDFLDFHFLIPVPLHAKKKRERGFNQAEYLARPLSERFDIPLTTDILYRTRHTPPQSGLSRRGRAENVEGVFAFNTRYEISGKKIILIDDIYTTGASLNECAGVLLKNGALEVKCMTLTVTLKKKSKEDDN